MFSRSLGAAISCTLLLILPSCASAFYGHVVAPGETLTSVAATDGLTVSQIAAANGLSTEAYLIAGTVLQIPPQSYGAGVYAPTSSSTSTSAVATPVSTSAVDTSDSGGYLVEPGDTLSAIAARDGTTVAELASSNGLDPDGILYAGATLRLPGAGSGSTTEYVSTTPVSSATAESQPVGSTAEGTAGGPPYPTDERVDGPEIAGIAEANGVPPALAEAIGWQESGWNNDEVSVDDAIGVMQILPGTWDWINRTLTAGTPLEPASAAGNVRGGVLLLHSLLSATGSDAMAAAGYYQGLSSVQQYGMYSDTQQYVNSVMSLEHGFGGG
jgi:N-acetylmuramoyl-L-alanine amidase